MNKTIYAALMTVVLLPTTKSFAYIKFINRADQHVDIAHGVERYFSGPCIGDKICGGEPFVRQMGWWGVGPGNNTTVWGGLWKKITDYWWFAEGWAGTTWYGDRPFCVTDSEHDRCANTAPATCPPGERRIGYRNQSHSWYGCGIGNNDMTITLSR